MTESIEAHDAQEVAPEEVPRRPARRIGQREGQVSAPTVLAPPWRQGSIRIAVSILLLSLAARTAAANSTDLATISSPTALLQLAFDKRFNYDLVQLVEISTTERTSTVSRVIQMATKRIDGRLHGLGYITAPERLRDTRLLMIENRDRSDDFFIYLPSEDKVRRVTSSRRADSFMGTGLSYEDLERRYVDDYVVADAGTDVIDGEPVRVISAKPNYESGHDIAFYFIAESDQAIREVRYWRGDKKRLLRVQRVPRDAIAKMGTHLVPTRIEIEDLQRRSHTTVTFSQIHLDPELDDKLFSRTAVEKGRPIPYLGREAGAAGEMGAADR